MNYLGMNYPPFKDSLYIKYWNDQGALARLRRPRNTLNDATVPHVDVHAAPRQVLLSTPSVRNYHQTVSRGRGHIFPAVAQSGCLVAPDVCGTFRSILPPLLLPPPPPTTPPPQFFFFSMCIYIGLSFIRQLQLLGLSLYQKSQGGRVGVWGGFPEELRIGIVI